MGTNEYPDVNFSVRLNTQKYMSFPNYAGLKKTVEMQYEDRNNTSKYYIFYRKDPFLFNLFRAVKLVEEFGRRLEDYIYFREKGPSDDNKYAYEVGGGNCLLCFWSLVEWMHVNARIY